MSLPLPSAKRAVCDQFPDAQCVRSTFGFKIVCGEEQQTTLIEVHGAGFVEEAWIAAADDCL